MLKNPGKPRFSGVFCIYDFASVWLIFAGFDQIWPRFYVLIMGQLRTKIRPILRFLFPFTRCRLMAGFCLYFWARSRWYSLSYLHIGKSGAASVSCKCKEGWMMMNKKRYLYLNDEKTRLALQSLIRFKNKLQQRGRYTDCVDELILKVSGIL